MLESLKSAKRLYSDFVFMNKIKERSNTAVFKPLGALFTSNCSRHINENRELQIILTIPESSRGINNIKYQLIAVLSFFIIIIIIIIIIIAIIIIIIIV